MHASISYNEEEGYVCDRRATGGGARMDTRADGVA
jgi:hypothetical protein